MRVAVVGSGIQGLCVALEFARRGAEVHLFDQEAEPMARASRHNEGKIHLGFVYANDPTLATGRLMARAALQFAPTLCELGVDLRGVIRSDPFIYAVHRRSLLTPDVLAVRYAAVAGHIAQQAAEPGADYFGVRIPQFIRRLPDAEWCRLFSDEHVMGAFETAEIAVDPHRLADAIVGCVRREPNIVFRLGTLVVGAGRSPRAIALTLEDGRMELFEQVVNCGWCGRLTLDAAAGLPPPVGWSFRRKHYLRLPPSTCTARIPPTTVVLGGFGDVVRYPSGHTFVSWYPAACQGLQTGMSPDSERTTEDERRALRLAMFGGAAEVVPALVDLHPGLLVAADLGSGVIFALGRTDVNDPSSRLHRRTDTGPSSFGRYHTIDTGKLTTAPLFARRLVRQVYADERAAS